MNSTVFILIGLDTPLSKILDNSFYVLAGILAILAGRAIAVYPILTALKTKLSWQNIVFWGGLHGTIPVALALSYSGPYREELVSMVFGVVIFSLIVQGLSLDYYARRIFGVSDEKMNIYEELRARIYAVRKSIEEVERMASKGEVSKDIAKDVIEKLENIEKKLEEKIFQVLQDENIRNSEYVKTWLESLEIQKNAIHELSRRGLVRHDVADKLIRELDEEIERFKEG